MCFVGIIKVEKSQDCLVTCLPVGKLIRQIPEVR